MPLLFIGILAVLAVWVISTYNFFVSAKARVNAAIQEIGNQLKRQLDLIPNLQASVKGYMKQEKSIFKMLTDARTMVASASKSGDLKKMSEAGSKLSEILPKLQIVVESNPELKSSEVVTNLMDELRDTSDKVMYSRRLLIDLTADYNVRRATFPSNLIASMFGFPEMKALDVGDMSGALEVGDEAKKTPKIDL